MQCDIGFGDAITPAATQQAYPSLLGMPEAVLAVYPLETVVAEKLEAMVKLASFNSRLNDYFADLTPSLSLRCDELGRP